MSVKEVLKLIKSDPNINEYFKMGIGPIEKLEMHDLWLRTPKEGPDTDCPDCGCELASLIECEEICECHFKNEIQRAEYVEDLQKGIIEIEECKRDKEDKLTGD